MPYYTRPPQARQDAPLPGLCSRVAQRLNVSREYASASSLAAASLGKGRVFVRPGWVGAIKGLFEHPVNIKTSSNGIL
jgi:hypothetical protein